MDSEIKMSYWGKAIFENTDKTITRYIGQTLNLINEELEDLPENFIRLPKLERKGKESKKLSKNYFGNKFGKSVNHSYHQSQSCEFRSEYSNNIEFGFYCYNQKTETKFPLIDYEPEKSDEEIFQDLLKSFEDKFNADSAAVLLLSENGEVLKSFIQNTAYNSNGNITLNMEEVQIEKLRREDIKNKISNVRKKAEENLENGRKEIEKLCIEISDFENAAKSKHNVALDRNFGSWIQRFLIFAEKFPEDRNIQRLREDLINNVLSGMCIYVADDETLELREDGTFNLPNQDYLIDSRNSKTEKYKVTRPAVYSDEQFLARGEIVTCAENNPAETPEINSVKQNITEEITDGAENNPANDSKINSTEKN